MKYELRDYQIDASNAAVKGLQEEKHPFVIQAATGAGKSLIIADICHRINKPILILQPSKEILEQNYQKLMSYNPEIDAGIYSASKGRKEIAKFTFATIGSIYKKPELFDHFNYVLIDECHGVNPKNLSGMLTSFLKAINCQHVCGLTATPYRIDTLWTRDKWGGLTATASLKMINRISRTPFFRKIAYKIETGDLIEQGYLSPIEYSVDNAELDELVVNSTGADFTTESLEKYWNEKRLSRIAAAVEYSNKHNKRTLVFCSSLRQASRAKEMVEAMGISAAMVNGKTPMKVREDLIAKFRAGEIKHMFNVGVFTTGFDVPELDCIVMARPTMSLALYYQMIGRGVRLDPMTPDKILQVYDLVGVVETLGRVETIRVHREKGGFRDEVWSEYGRMDACELYSFVVKKKARARQ
jgi:DNA repair protein RadD